MRIDHHGDHGIVPDQCGEFDCTLDAEAVDHAFVSGIADEMFFVCFDAFNFFQTFI
jgi:hypothetical protein